MSDPDRPYSPTNQGAPRSAPSDQQESPASGAEGHRIIAAYETLERARSVEEQLRQEGIAAGSIDLHERPAAAADLPGAETQIPSGDRNEFRDDGGLLGMVEALFAPPNDRRAYANAVQRGAVVLSVIATPEQHDRVAAILEEAGPSEIHEADGDAPTGTTTSPSQVRRYPIRHS